MSRTKFGIAVGAVLLSCVPPASAQSESSNPAWWVAPTHRVIRESFSFTSAAVRLSGTLVRPQASGPAPVAIVLHGATVGRRDAPLYGHLQEMLPKLGIGVLIFDRRGEGASGGARETHGFDLLAGDGVAAFAALARDPRVDPRRIGFWGLSQGGWLTLLAAAKEPRAAFAVSVSAPIVTADVQMNFAVANLLRVNGYSQADIDAAVRARTAVDDFTRGKVDRATAAAAEAAVADKPWYDLIYLKGNIDDPGWLKQITSDPLKALDGSRVPTLMLYGQGDPWVPVGVSLDALRRTAARHPNVATMVIDGADHMMMTGIDPKVQMDTTAAASAASKDAPDAPAYFAAIAGWLAQQRIGKLENPE